LSALVISDLAIFAEKTLPWGRQAEKLNLTLTINRSDLEHTMMGTKTLEVQIADGTAKVQGGASILNQLASTMVDFDPRFEIMPDTKAKDAKVAHANDYEAVPRQMPMALIPVLSHLLSHRAAVQNMQSS
jgi:hypothetical protein